MTEPLTTDELIQMREQVEKRHPSALSFHEAFTSARRDVPRLLATIGVLEARIRALEEAIPVLMELSDTISEYRARGLQDRPVATRSYDELQELLDELGLTASQPASQSPAS